MDGHRAAHHARRPAVHGARGRLVTAGVEHDVLRIGYHDVSDADRAVITALHPRPDHKRQILAAFTDGIAAKQETTFGNVKADVVERFVPGF